MNRVDNATIAHNMKWGLILLAALALALFLGNLLAADTIRGLVSSSFIVLGLAWLMIGAKYWWLPLPIALSAGGTFQVGFKIVPHEIAVAVAFLTLAIALPLRWRQMLQKQRDWLAPSFLLLCGYLLLHWLANLAFNKYNGIGGAGNVTRAYAYSLWPIVLILAFHLFGNSKQTRVALKTMFVISFLRAAIAYLDYIVPLQIYIPGINYVPPFASGSHDFKLSGPLLASTSLFLFLISKNHSLRVLYFTMFLFGSFTLLLGGGRSYVATFSVLPFLLLIIYRKYLLGAMLFGGALIAIAILNLFPLIADVLPGDMGRSAHLVIWNADPSSRWYGSVAGSNDFHDRLNAIGVSRWTREWNTIVFGTGIRPFNKDALDPTLWDSNRHFEQMLNNAANTGSYESGLLTVLAVTGVIGLALYLNVFRSMMFVTWRSLRKNGIMDSGHAFACMGMAMSIAWMTMSWRFGHFPSEALFYLYLGYISIRDQQVVAQQARSVSRSPDSASSLTTGGPPSQPGTSPEYGNPAYS